MTSRRRRESFVVLVLSLLVAGCAAGRPPLPTLSAGPVTKDGLHRVESVETGVLFLTPDYRTAGYAIMEAGGFAIGSCDVQFRDPFQEDKYEDTAERMRERLCQAVEREILSRGRSGLNPEPRPGMAIVDVWLMDVVLKPPNVDAGTIAFIEESTNSMTFALRASIEGQDRDFMRYYSVGRSGGGTYVGPIISPDWRAISGLIDDFVGDAVGGMYDTLNALDPDRPQTPPVGAAPE
jgi:hypothetical protein